MTQVTVKQLADEVKTPVERLLQQMREAGLPHTAADEGVSDSEAVFADSLEEQPQGESGRTAQDYIAAQNHQHPACCW